MSSTSTHPTHESRHFTLIITACAVALLSTVGASLPYPILAPLFADGHANGLNHFLGWPPKLLLCLALAVYPLGMFLGSAILSPMSDRYGRRRILLITLGAAALGHGISVLALLQDSYPLFMLARFATGLAEGNVAVARAMLADALHGPERQRAFAWYNSADYAGWLLGPLVAGLSVGFGVAVPFAIAALVLAATWAAGLQVFPRTQAHSLEGGFWHQVTERHALRLLGHSELREVFLIHLAYTFGVTAFYEFFPLWLVEFVGLSARGISLVSAGVCLFMTLTSALVGRGTIDPGPTRRIAIYSALCAAMIACNAIGGPVLGVISILGFGIPNALYNAILSNYCSERYARFGQGRVLGLLPMTFCIANVVVALLGGLITLFDTRLMLLLGAALTACAALRMPIWLRGHQDAHASAASLEGVQS